jgi:hypothetical protein
VHCPKLKVLSPAAAVLPPLLLLQCVRVTSNGENWEDGNNRKFKVRHSW